MPLIANSVVYRRNSSSSVPPTHLYQLMKVLQVERLEVLSNLHLLAHAGESSATDSRCYDSLDHTIRSGHSC
jgi:hypothetical protein